MVGRLEERGIRILRVIIATKLVTGILGIIVGIIVGMVIPVTAVEECTEILCMAAGMEEGTEGMEGLCTAEDMEDTAGCMVDMGTLCMVVWA